MKPAPPRVICHVDLDAFYAQVEAKLHPELAGQPIGVIQYNPFGDLTSYRHTEPRIFNNSHGSLIAVGYGAARAAGVKRGMRGKEARALCPELQLVQVPTSNGKADLSEYRRQGQLVLEVLAESYDGVEVLCEKASVDESYLDVTDAALRRLAQRGEAWDGQLPVNASAIHVGSQADGAGAAAAAWFVRPAEEWGAGEQLLAHGAAIVAEKRAAVLERTGFTCSAGVGHTKLMAKLCSGLHKPFQQTVLPYTHVAALLCNLPVSKLRGLGGQFGATVSAELGVATVGELAALPLSVLQAKFGEDEGRSLFGMARGQDNGPVKPRKLPKSVGCGKSFTAHRKIVAADKALYWMGQLSQEIAERLEEDVHENGRHAQHLTVQVSFTSGQKSRGGALCGRSASVVADAAQTLLRRCLADAGHGWTVTGLALAASKFGTAATQRSDIQQLFGTARSAARPPALPTAAGRVALPAVGGRGEAVQQGPGDGTNTPQLLGMEHATTTAGPVLLAGTGATAVAPAPTVRGGRGAEGRVSGNVSTTPQLLYMAPRMNKPQPALKAMDAGTAALTAAGGGEGAGSLTSAGLDTQPVFGTAQRATRTLASPAGSCAAAPGLCSGDMSEGRVSGNGPLQEAHGHGAAAGHPPGGYRGCEQPRGLAVGGAAGAGACSAAGQRTTPETHLPPESDGVRACATAQDKRAQTTLLSTSRYGTTASVTAGAGAGWAAWLQAGTVEHTVGLGVVCGETQQTGRRCMHQVGGTSGVAHGETVPAAHSKLQAPCVAGGGGPDGAADAYSMDARVCHPPASRPEATRERGEHVRGARAVLQSSTRQVAGSSVSCAAARVARAPDGLCGVVTAAAAAIDCCGDDQEERHCGSSGKSADGPGGLAHGDLVGFTVREAKCPPACAAPRAPDVTARDGRSAGGGEQESRLDVGAVDKAVGELANRAAGEGGYDGVGGTSVDGLLLAQLPSELRSEAYLQSTLKRRLDGGQTAKSRPQAGANTAKRWRQLTLFK